MKESMRKRVLALILILLMVITVVAACSKDDDTPREPGGPAKAMFITHSMNDASQRFSWSEFQRLMGDFNIEMTEVSGDNNTSAEIASIERAVSEGYDVIFINPTDAEAIIPALQRAKEANVIVGLFSSRLPAGHTSEDIIDFLCSTDDFLSAMMAGEYINQHFTDGANVVEIRGPVGEADYLHNGFIAGLADNINVLATQHSNGWSANEARQIMDGFLNDFGNDINIVWCHWDDGANGAIEAARAAGRDDIFIIGVGGNRVGYQNVFDGLQQLSVARNYTVMVRQSLQNARTLLDGGSVSHINIIPMDMITPDTVSNFTRPDW